MSLAGDSCPSKDDSVCKPAQTVAARPVHHLKCWPIFFQMIVDGKKPLEVRANDRNFLENDLICVHEWDPDLAKRREADGYTGRSAGGTILSVLAPPLVHVRDGYVAMGVAWHYVEVVYPGESPSLRKL